MSSPFLDLEGNSIRGEQIVGYGGSGIVILNDHQLAVKIPLRYRSSTDDDVDVNIEAIQREQDVYRRLDRCDGVVPCISFSETAIQLALWRMGIYVLI